MKTLAAAAISAFFLTLFSAAPVRAQELTCEDYRCEFQLRLETECDCSESANHGQYVSCVAHIIKELVDEGLPKNCKGKLQRCAARSVCGKQDRGFATCTSHEYGTCVDLLCDTDGTTVCATNTDCLASTKCRITRHPERCTEDGGLLNLAPTCCSSANCSVE